VQASRWRTRRAHGNPDQRDQTESGWVPLARQALHIYRIRR